MKSIKILFILVVGFLFSFGFLGFLFKPEISTDVLGLLRRI